MMNARLYKIFSDYLSFKYDLWYSDYCKLFWTKDEVSFGYITDENYFKYSHRSGIDLKSMFGDASNELLFIYLSENYPHIRINGICGDFEENDIRWF